MKFITALNCMDGRTIKPILKYFQNELNMDLYIDMITEPDMDGF
ncbi:MAG: carbonic anhydrase [bacterium]